MDGFTSANSTPLLFTLRRTICYGTALCSNRHPAICRRHRNCTFESVQCWLTREPPLTLIKFISAVIKKRGNVSRRHSRYVWQWSLLIKLHWLISNLHVSALNYLSIHFIQNLIIQILIIIYFDTGVHFFTLDLCYFFTIFILYCRFVKWI